MTQKMTSIGLMSGTSVDGLDVCCATFTRKDGKWSFHIDCARGYDYPQELRQKLGRDVQNMSAYEFVAFHSEYGRYLGQRVNEFMAEFGVKPDIIASHGSTVFHEPAKRIMYQIGDGAAIAAETGIPTVSDFRRLDIMLGGQGAPLVPVGDNLLFGEYDYCLNIGGFSNISWREGERRVAFDISPVNYVINRFARTVGLEMDRDGLMASKGHVDQALLRRLNALDYYSRPAPKSLGREWVEANVFPLLDGCGLSLEDLLRTYYEHCAVQLSKVTVPGRSLLVTGGGAYNKFLIERMRELSGCNIVVPETAIIEFKEALIFAFLGVLYMTNQVSCLSSVTGARQDNIGGMLFKIN
ncbi:MAG: anhydro-N-acetylmuramic acid kinase [Bacteroidales bacterium]|nr:anhydro-N-acetylmuramic acid kinase [Bacteroidales bacterium]